MEAVDRAIETSGAALREQLISRFHEDSARANRVSVSHDRATVAISAFEHIRGVDKVYVGFDWAFYASWLLVKGHASAGLYASMVVKRGGRTVIEPTTAHFYDDTLPVLSANLRVHSLQDAKRRMRYFRALDRVTPDCDRNYQMRFEYDTILDLLTGCSFIRYIESPPPPPDFATSPCGPDGLPLEAGNEPKPDAG